MSARTLWLVGIALVFAFGFARGMPLALGQGAEPARAGGVCEAGSPEPVPASVPRGPRRVASLRPVAGHAVEEAYR